MQSSLRATALMSVLAGVLMCVRQDMLAPLHKTAADTLHPGHRLLYRLEQQMNGEDRQLSGSTRTTDSPGARQIEALREELRGRDAEIAVLRERLRHLAYVGASPYKAGVDEPLLVPELIHADVLAHERARRTESALMIAGGHEADVTDGLLVLKGKGTLIDQGEDDRVTRGQPVYAGQCVVGRIEQAGRWTSRIQPVTSTGYSGRAQLARRSSDGTVFDAEGILEGTGDGFCRLTGIPVTEPVSVGDEVFTGGRSGRLPYPMYYGRVVRAESSSGTQWEIVVRPAARSDELRSVMVLRETLNPIRVLGQ